jgi:quinol monooxygenase YgiN
MSDHIAIATLIARPGHADAVAAALRELITPTHAEEGCILYALHRGLGDPDTFVFVERWGSADALASHGQQPWVAGLSDIADLLTGPPHLATYRALPDGDLDKGRL